MTVQIGCVKQRAGVTVFDTAWKICWDMSIINHDYAKNNLEFQNGRFQSNVYLLEG